MARRPNAILVTALVSLMMASVAPVRAGERVPFAAAGGLALAVSAAEAWAPDARLVYLENDEPVDASGRAERWGYLFHSESLGEARGYSVRENKILEAADLGFDFEAPPVAGEWVDSGAALLAAEDKAGRGYRQKHGGQLSSMLLMRGAFHEKDPNVTTWTLVYTSALAPSLFVVVDASDGKVVRTWKG